MHPDRKEIRAMLRLIKVDPGTVPAPKTSFPATENTMEAVLHPGQPANNHVLPAKY